MCYENDGTQCHSPRPPLADRGTMGEQPRNQLAASDGHQEGVASGVLAGVPNSTRGSTQSQLQTMPCERASTGEGLTGPAPLLAEAARRVAVWREEGQQKEAATRGGSQQWPDEPA